MGRNRKRKYKYKDYELCLKYRRKLCDIYKEKSLEELREDKIKYETRLLISECKYLHQIQSYTISIFAMLLTAALFLFKSTITEENLKYYSIIIFAVIALLLVVSECIILVGNSRKNYEKFDSSFQLGIITELMREKESK
jgi:hypothetical protein